MIPRERKVTGLARNVVIAETAVGGAVVVLAGAVETSVRVPRTVLRPGIVRHETNAAPPRERRLREVIPVIGRAAREVGIVPAVIVVHGKIGRMVSVPRNEILVAATNLGRSRLPASQPRRPYPQPAVSTISVLEFLKNNLKLLPPPPARPMRFPLVGLVRNRLRKLHEQRILSCEAEADQRIGRLRMNSFGPTKIRTCDRHRSAAWSRLRGFRRPKRRVSPMKWSRPLTLSRWTKTTTHCVRVAVVAVVVGHVRSRVHLRQMAMREPRSI